MASGRALFGWLVTTLLGLGVTGAIMTSYLPARDGAFSTQTADGSIFTALYAAVFLLLLGLGMCLAWYLQSRSLTGQTIAGNWRALRQSTLVAIGLTILLALRGFDVLSWLDAGLLVTALVLVELSFHVKSTS